MKVLIALISVVILTSCSEKHPSVQTLQLNRQGGQHLQKQSFAEAQTSFLQALQFDPFNPALHLNLGLSFEALQLADKALPSYKEAGRLADQSSNIELQFMSRFNQAQLLAKAKKIDEAIAMYQTALDVVPDSIETKHNIELLVQSQQGEGQGEGEPQDQEGEGNSDSQKKDQKGQGEQKDKKESDQDSKDQESENKENEKENEKKPQERKSSPKYVPRAFNGKELSEGDVKKILGELKQQESRIRSEYNKKEGKEQPRDKDW